MATTTRPKLEDLSDDAFIRMAFVLTLFPFSKSTIWRKIKAGKFPKPIKISDNITAWKVSAIREELSKIGQGVVQ